MSSPSDFNDPFDCTGAIVGNVTDYYFDKYLKPVLGEGWIEGVREDEEFGCCDRGTTKHYITRIKECYKRGLIRQHLVTRKVFNDYARILCLSRVNEINRTKGDDFRYDMLLWSHYASEGRGLRIGVEVDGPDLPEPITVDYSDSMPRLNLSALNEFIYSEPRRDHPYIAFLEKCLSTKSRSWAYEREVRLAFSVNDRQIEKAHNGLYFLKMTPACIWRVDFGHMTFRDDAEFLSVVSKLRARGYCHTEFRLAALDQRHYGYRFRSWEEVHLSETRRLEKERRKVLRSQLLRICSVSKKPTE